MPPQRLSSQTESAYSISCPRSRTLVWSHTAARSRSLPFNGLLLHNPCKYVDYYSFTDPGGRRDGRLSRPGWLTMTDSLRTKWSPVNNRSGAAQGSPPALERYLNHWATPKCNFHFFDGDPCWMLPANSLSVFLAATFARLCYIPSLWLQIYWPLLEIRQALVAISTA